jgi:hypothetical protein
MFELFQMQPLQYQTNLCDLFILEKRGYIDHVFAV